MYFFKKKNKIKINTKNIIEYINFNNNGRV